MTVAEIIADQLRKCEMSKASRHAPPTNMHSDPIAPKKMTRDEIERAYVDDRTYDGKVPEGGMDRIMRMENPGEYVGRDGTRTFCPWRYVSMRDLELPDNGNPYRKPAENESKPLPKDSWNRPSGYEGSAAGPGGIGGEYDPWSAQYSAGSVGNDAFAPSIQQTSTGIAPSWDAWLAPDQEAVHPGHGNAINGMDVGALDLMRNMRK